jgi:hypothetical protein
MRPRGCNRSISPARLSAVGPVVGEGVGVDTVVPTVTSEREQAGLEAVVLELELELELEPELVEAEVDEEGEAHRATTSTTTTRAATSELMVLLRVPPSPLLLP